MPTAADDPALSSGSPSSSGTSDERAVDAPSIETEAETPSVAGEPRAESESERTGDNGGFWSESTRHARGREWLGALSAMGIATGLALAVMRVWNGSFSVPWRFGGDADFYLMVTDAIVTDGWYLSNPKLAAPFGQDLYDLPHGLTICSSRSSRSSAGSPVATQEPPSTCTSF